MAQEMPAGAKQPTRTSYVFPLVAWLLVTGMWVWLLLSKRPSSKQLNHEDMVLVGCFFGASLLYLGQIIRRLLQPDRALSRAIAINQWLETKPSPWFEWMMWVLRLSMLAVMIIGLLFPGSFHLHLRVWTIYGVFFQVSAFLRDLTLVGIVPEEDTWPKPRNVAELKPVTSEQWGQS